MLILLGSARICSCSVGREEILTAPHSQQGDLIYLALTEDDDDDGVYFFYCSSLEPLLFLTSSVNAGLFKDV